MKKKSHMLLGRFLIDELQNAPARRYRKMFLFGCVQPDYNLFTFLKGSLQEGFLDGHNFKYTEHHILRSIEKLQETDGLLLLKYYRLGKLTHYLADAFTAPHNDSFRVADHVRYEIELHSQLEKEIAAISELPLKSEGGPIQEYLLSAHNQYGNSTKNQKVDVEYILNCSSTAFSLLLPEEELIGMNAMALHPASA